jgi:hypothetical protein
VRVSQARRLAGLGGPRRRYVAKPAAADLPYPLNRAEQTTRFRAYNASANATRWHVPHAADPLSLSHGSDTSRRPGQRPYREELRPAARRRVQGVQAPGAGAARPTGQPGRRHAAVARPPVYVFRGGSRAVALWLFSSRAARQAWAPEIQQEPDTKGQGKVSARPSRPVTHNKPNEPKTKSRGKPAAPTPRSAGPVCMGCGVVISFERLRAVPTTTYCVDCASTRSSGQRNRRIVESWGTRSDWKKDRSSWKRNH